MAQPLVGVDEQSTRHTSTPKGRFVLRADSIRPYQVRAKWFGIRSFFLLYFSKCPLSISPCVFPQTVIPYPCNMEKRGNFHERTGNY